MHTVDLGDAVVYPLVNVSAPLLDHGGTTVMRRCDGSPIQVLAYHHVA